jgi:hypothetical protein
MKMKRYGWILVPLAAAAMFATLWHAPSLIWDDDSNIFKNPYYLADLWRPFWTAPYFGLYVPVTSSIWEILFRVGDGAPWPFRALNFVLHAGNVTLVYFLLRRLAREWRLTSQGPILLATAIFAFHPLQVETVAWISGGRDLLAAFFALAATLIFFSSKKSSHQAFAFGLFIVALLCKPSVATLPLVLLCLRPTLWLVPWFMSVAGSIFLTYGAQAEHLPAILWWQRPWIMLDTYAFYAGKTLFPWPLTANYARSPQWVIEHPVTLAVGLTVAAVLIGSMIYFRRRKIAVTAALGAWAILLLPVSGLATFAFQEISTTADHYSYLPLVAVSVLFLLLTASVKSPARRSLLAAIPLAFAALSFWQLQYWRSNGAFFKHMAEFAPTSYSTAIGMSVVACQEDSDFEAGIHWTDVALRAKSKDILALANRAYCFLHGHKLHEAVALGEVVRTLDRETLRAKQPTGYSSLLASVGTAKIRFGELREGYQFLCESFQTMPSEPIYRRNLLVAERILRERGLKAECEHAP